MCENDRFSIVSTKPNASVAPIHNRMPLMLGPRKSSVWLDSGFANLTGHSSIVPASSSEQSSKGPREL